MGFGWKKWTRQNLNRLETLLASGSLIENIRFRGRTKENIRRKARKLGLIPIRGFSPLSRGQRKKLRQLIKEGYSSAQIAEYQMLGKEKKTRTVHNICKWMGKLRLVHKNRSRAAQKRKIFSKREKKSFDNFLRRHSTELSAKQIARKFGVKTGTVQARQRKLGVKPPFAVVIKIPSNRRKYRASMRKRSIKVLAEFDSNIAKREQMLIDRYHAMMSKNQVRDVPFEERICRVCKKKWLKHKSFFYYHEVRCDGYTIWYFYSTCVICVAKWRHQKKLQKASQC